MKFIFKKTLHCFGGIVNGFEGGASSSVTAGLPARASRDVPVQKPLTEP